MAKSVSLRPCLHQVAGHLVQDGKAGSLVDDAGRFIKPLQEGRRGEQEQAFYDRVLAEKRAWSHESAAKSQSGCEASSTGQGGDQHAHHGFCIRNAVLLSAIPEYYGVMAAEGRRLLVLEDLARQYRHPCIMDIKLGFRTWHAGMEPDRAQRRAAADAKTSQGTLGFKICGMQVYRQSQRRFWRASRRWCKELLPQAVSDALARFADNEGGLLPAHVYSGPCGASSQLQHIAAWFQVQCDFRFYSSSVLLLYEGGAVREQDVNVSVRMIDFAHTTASDDGLDENYLGGLLSLERELGKICCNGN